MVSSPRDEALVQLLLQRLQDPDSVRDSAGTSEYEVLLSFPSQEQPNHVDVGEVLLWPGNAHGLGASRPRPDTALSPQWVPLGTSSSPADEAKRT